MKTKYVADEEKGAVCYLREAGVLSAVERSRALTLFFKDNVELWYAGVEEHIDIRLEDLILVTGTIKSKSYKLVAIYPTRNLRIGDRIAREVTLGPDTYLLIRGQKFKEREWCFNDADRHKVPSLFLRYYKMKMRLCIFKTVKANAGPHTLPPGGDHHDDNGAVVSAAYDRAAGYL